MKKFTIYLILCLMLISFTTLVSADPGDWDDPVKTESTNETINK